MSTPGVPRGRGRQALIATVVSTSQLTPTMVRVVLGGGPLAGFEPSPHADSYVKLFFVPGAPGRSAGAGLLAPFTSPEGVVDLAAAREALPEPPLPRTYTVRAVEAGRITLDVVVHGDEGLAGPWALAAAPGDTVALAGPGGGYSPDPAADHHLLAGDPSALPAIAVALERMPAGARGDAFLEVSGPREQLELAAPEGVRVHWVHRGPGGVPGLALVEAVRALEWPTGRVQAFVHGEAGTVRELRRYLREERRVPLADLSASGYWRLGADDEAWRSEKAEWQRGVERSDAEAGL